MARKKTRISRPSSADAPSPRERRREQKALAKQAKQAKKDEKARKARAALAGDPETGVTGELPVIDSALARHDLWVVLVALAVIAFAGSAHRALVSPTLDSFELRGLRLGKPRGFLPAMKVPVTPSALAGDFTGEPEPGLMLPDLPSLTEPIESTHIVYQAASDPLLRLEVRIDARPEYSNLVGALGIERASRYGASYWSAGSRIDNIDGRDWTRTEFRYAHRASETDSPRIAHAIEFAAVNGPTLFVVTFHGDERSAEALADLVASTLILESAEPSP